MFLWPCIVSKAWRKNTNKMQQYKWFIVNSRCWLLTTVSTCFGHLYAHHQEKRPRVTAYGFQLVLLDVAGCGAVVLRCRVWALWRSSCNLHSAHTLQHSTTAPQPATSNTTSENPYAVTRSVLCFKTLIHLFLHMLKYVLHYKCNCIMISKTFNFFNT